MNTDSSEMKEEAREKIAREVAHAYLDFADAIRLATLPDWVHADLTTSQVKAIFLLAHHGSLPVGRLATLLRIGSPAASILVQQLVEQELVERAEDPRDRRRTLVSLTARGSKLVSGQRDKREAKLVQWLGQLDNDALEGLLRGLRALNSVMR